jgi:hypothetical protein
MSDTGAGNCLYLRPPHLRKVLPWRRQRGPLAQQRRQPQQRDVMPTAQLSPPTTARLASTWMSHSTPAISNDAVEF